MINLSKIFVSLFYIGFFPFASGTFASLISIFILFFLFNILSHLFMIFLFFLILFFSILFIKYYAKDLEIKDAKEIVIDEFVGIFLIMIFFQYLNFSSELIILLNVFIFFRIFDIFKPGPVGRMDDIKSGTGIMMDDVIAGILALLVTQSLVYFIV